MGNAWRLYVVWGDAPIAPMKEVVVLNFRGIRQGQDKDAGRSHAILFSQLCFCLDFAADEYWRITGPEIDGTLHKLQNEWNICGGQELQAQRHCIPEDCRVVVTSILGGLHHEYELEKIAA